MRHSTVSSSTSAQSKARVGDCKGAAEAASSKVEPAKAGDKALHHKQLATGQTCSRWCWRGLPLVDGCLQMPFQQGKICWCDAGCHGGRAVLDDVLGQVPQPGLAS